MIRALAQIISRQVCMHPPKEGIHEDADSSPPSCQHSEQIPSTSHARSSVNASTRGTRTLAADQWPELPDQALVVLFTHLAQRYVQAARAQEETHE